MKIEPTLLTHCADAGAKAALSTLPDYDTLLNLSTTNVSERSAREAFAQAVIESYFPALDIGLMPLAMFVGMHPDVQEGELFSDAALRLIKERDGMKLRLAQLEWRPVSETPDNWWTSKLLGLRREGAEHQRVMVVCAASFVSWEAFGRAFSHWAKLPPLPAPAPFDLWWSTATDEEKQDAARAGREGSAE